MKYYRSDNRGKFQCEGYSRQLVSFDGMVFQGRSESWTVSPTDIDGYIQLDKNNIFIFFELKYGNGDVPEGQKHALTTLVDAISGDALHDNNSILFIATHEEKAEQIEAKKANVIAVYNGYKWRKMNGAKNHSLLECINLFIKSCEKDELEWE